MYYPNQFTFDVEKFFSGELDISTFLHENKRLRDGDVTQS